MKYTLLLIFVFVTQACRAKHVIISEWIDEKLGIPEIINNYDPLGLPVMKESFNITELDSGIHVTLSDGELTGLSSVKREGNFSLTYHPDAIRLHARLRFEKDLEGNFNFSYKTFRNDWSDAGTANVIIKNVTAELIIEWKLSELFVAKPSIHNLDGDLDWTVETKSKLPFDQVSHFLKSYFYNYFKQPVLGRVEDILTSMTRIIMKKVYDQKLPSLVSELGQRLKQAIVSGMPGVNVLHHIRDVIARGVPDPLELPDIASPPIEIPDSSLMAMVNLTNVELYGLTTLESDGDIHFEFPPGVIRLTGLVFFKELIGKSNCSYAKGFKTYDSVLKVSVKNITAKWSVDFNLIKWSLENPDAKIDYEKPIVTMTPSPVDSILHEAIIKTVPKLYHHYNVLNFVTESLIKNSREN